MARSYITSNPEYWRKNKNRKRRVLPLWFTLSEVANAIGVARNSALFYVKRDQLIPMARTASGAPLFNESQVRRFVAWHGARGKGRRKK